MKVKIIYYINLLHFKEDYFVSKFYDIKSHHLKSINQLLINTNFTDENDTFNRIKVQELRSIISKLLYLLPPNELKEIGKKLPTINKISDLQVIINAITKIDVIPALKYCGKVIQTICEIWGNADLDIIILSKQDFMKIEDINKVIDSILIMTLYGVIDFDFVELSLLLNERNQKYCAVVLGYSINLTEDEKKFSYLSELYGLFNGKSLEEKREYLTTRFDQEEGLSLAGLNLGFGYSL